MNNGTKFHSTKMFSANKNIKKPRLSSRNYVPPNFDICKGLLFAEQFYFKNDNSYIYVYIHTRRYIAYFSPSAIFCVLLCIKKSETRM